jgi:hypothetical protein
MSWWSGLKSVIFGAPKLTEDIFDRENGLLAKVGGFLNDLHLSDPERIKLNLEAGRDVLEHVKATANENTIKSKTRRELAVKWIYVQLYLVLLNVICVPLAVLSPEQGKAMFNMMLKITLSWLMVGGTVTVMAYFFGTYGWGTYIRKGDKK